VGAEKKRIGAGDFRTKGGKRARHNLVNVEELTKKGNPPWEKGRVKEFRLIKKGRG